MPDPTGERGIRIGLAEVSMEAARTRLRDAAKDADEAHAPELHRRIMVAITAVEDAIDETTNIAEAERRRLR